MNKAFIEYPKTSLYFFWAPFRDGLVRLKGGAKTKEIILFGKNRIYSLIVFASFLLMLSCNEEPVAIPDFVIPQTNKVVLIEDLTGVRCPNCPKGAAAIESILSKYKEKVVAVGIHGGFLTTPLSNSKYDFRNPKAIELEEFLKPYIGKPAAQVNRIKFPDQDFVSIDAIELWENYIDQELRKEQEMEIVLKHSYDASTKKIDLAVTAGSLINEAGAFNISIYITENKIIDPQETKGAIIERFEHNHVLRDMITSAKGDLLISNISKGQSIQKSYSYTLPANIKPENTEIVVMVARANNRSVLQAKKVKLL
jgi:galactitol-specific phosphotransferase system IIB component